MSGKCSLLPAVKNVIGGHDFSRNQSRFRRIGHPEKKGKWYMWERFSTSGLAGSYVDELLAAGIEARMDFRPRRALDPCPFLVSPIEDDEAEPFFSTAFRMATSVGNARPGS